MNYTADNTDDTNLVDKISARKKERPLTFSQRVLTSQMLP